MKKIFLAICSIISMHSFAQNTFPANGNTGIGTSSPTAPLHIVGGAGNTLLLEKPTTGYPGIALQGTNYASVIEGGDALRFYTNGTLRVNVNPNGNVGIGTTNPGFKLTVMGDSYANGHIYSDISSNEGGAISFINNLKTGKNVNSWTIYNMTGIYGNGLKFWRYSADLTNTGPQFSLNDDGTSTFLGRLGIGTTIPDQALTIKGGGIGFDNNSSDKKLYSPVDGVLEWMTHNAAGEHAFAVSHQGEQKVYLNTNGSSYLIGGNVGIGVTNPTEKLSVNGNIRSKKVIVTQTGWPDYVFDSAYQLPSLDSVSSFIQVNKHLPDMPSAAVVEKDGHDLGEVQKALLKKVEELTLYVIKQEQLIKEQNKSIQQLHDEIKTLKQEKVKP